MKSKQTEIEDLLCNDSFIAYCKGSSVVDIERWEAYGNQATENLLLIEKAREKYLQLFNVLAKLDLEEQENRLLNKLEGGKTAPLLVMHEQSTIGSRSIKSILIRVFAAASVISIIFFGFNYLNLKNSDASKTFKSNYGERKNFQLPDGSVVILNSGSKIEINQNYGVTSRDIYLEGEAFFDVKHNKDLPFIVHTDAMDVRALGTVFNVNAYSGGGITETSLISGVVEVTLHQENNRKVLLRPNQKVKWTSFKERSDLELANGNIVDDSSVVTQNVVQQLRKTDDGDFKETAWVDNKLIFSDNTLHEIAKLLERWYGVEIIFVDEVIGSYRFTGHFEKEELVSVLEVLKEAKAFNYEFTAGNTPEIKLYK